jgi:hypothetical protein
MNRPRAADEFATIRARMEELRREREGNQAERGGAAGRAPAARWGYPLAARDQRGAKPGPTVWPDAQLGWEEDCAA